MRGGTLVKRITEAFRRPLLTPTVAAGENTLIGAATRLFTTSTSDYVTLGKEVRNEVRQLKSLGKNGIIGRYEPKEVKVKNFKLEDCGEITLGGDIFDVPLRQDIVQRVVLWQLAKRRQGTHSTKTRYEVNRTGRKPYSQKGSGQARHGDLKAPQFRGGGVVHGPKPRSHEIGLPKKVRRLGLKVALSARLAEGKLMVMDSLELEDHKTKNVINFVKSLDKTKKVLMVDGHWAANENLKRASGNLHYANTIPAGGLNVYSILQHDTLILSLDAVKRLEERLRTPINR